jgi:hypothetical protein
MLAQFIKSLRSRMSAFGGIADIAAKLPMRHEPRRIAANIAKLPDLLRGSRLLPSTSLVAAPPSYAN